MNKLKEEELLVWLKENIDRYAFLQISHPHLAYYPTERDKQAYQQIRERIQAYAEHQELTANYIDIVIDLYDQLEQKKIEVDEEFIKKWTKKLEADLLPYSVVIDIDKKKVKQMLKEVGMEVVEK